MIFVFSLKMSALNGDKIKNREYSRFFVVVA